MKFLEFFTQKGESNEGKLVGNFEITASNLVASFTGLVSQVGMVNPATIANTSAKGVQITKTGNDKYLIKLLMFAPPITLEWTNLKSLDLLFETLDELSKSNKKVGYATFTNLQDGQKLFQLAVSN